MTDKQVLIIATLTAKAGKGDELQPILQRCVVESRKEPGNVHYDLYRSEENPDAFIFHETWKSVAAVDEHERQPHYLTLQAEAPPLLAAAPQVVKI